MRERRIREKTNDKGTGFPSVEPISSVFYPSLKGGHKGQGDKVLETQYQNQPSV